MNDEKESWSDLYKKEDWWAIWFAAAFIALVAAGILKQVAKIGKWSANPLAAFPPDLFLPLGLLFLVLGAVCAVGVYLMGNDYKKFLMGYTVVFLISILSFAVSHQKELHLYGLSYAIWALAIGLVIANSVGTPDWLKQGARSEMFIKTGLVLLGAEILFNRILQLGGPGLIVAWVVTPIVTIVMFYFGTRILKMVSKPLVIVIAAATSVCGVSAAIAVAAASKAKKEELTLAVGMTMIFTVLMMVGMPALARLMDLSPAVAGAWLGGTIDSTGAVVAAGAVLGEQAEKVAAVVKMVQNVLIGLVAFVVAVIWTTRFNTELDHKPSPIEVWRRFPKFILGFVLASAIFSFLLIPVFGEKPVSAILDQSKQVREWLFCLAFVSIGLESNFKELASQMTGGKPMILYGVGQTFNVLLTLLMAWLVFGGIIFKPVF